MGRLTDEAARQLVRRADGRRANGSRGLRARWAWRRLVLRCASGDPAAQDGVRAIAGKLPGPDVLDLLAAAPAEPADRAAYLTLIGQGAQRQALDPDGSYLALAYRAAAPEVRERLRTVMAAEGDADVIRVVVSGDQRDRIAEMSEGELDYLGHQLAEHRRWDELRRLIRDLPVPKAVAAAQLLPAEEYPENDAALLSMLAERSARELLATVERLPATRLITHVTGGGHRGSYLGASLSPDLSEVALRYGIWKRGQHNEIHVETLRIGTGETTHRFRGDPLRDVDSGNSILHLGDEIVIRLEDDDHRHQIVRVVPDLRALGSPSALSDMRRASGGAVLVCPTGLAFVDPGAHTLRRLEIPRFKNHSAVVSDASCTLTTFPEDRLVAVYRNQRISVVNEDGTVRCETRRNAGSTSGFSPALSFLSPNSLALHINGTYPPQALTEIWKFPSKGAPRRTAKHTGAIPDRWPYEEWQGKRLDDSFVIRIYNDAEAIWVDPLAPWIQRGSEVSSRLVSLLGRSPGGDMYFTEAVAPGPQRLEIHSPHLPDARALLERPLLHSTPADLRRVLELRPKIGDLAVREALDLLAAALSERFGGDIALGSTTAVPRGGPTDIALGRDGTE
ncbi:hypothetical protein [Streptomyces sp. GESEQ-4]|uniref:hypothetical protein n=1 Tax=Streptomyces sp. GESEQ-4 TaxID=2812655 RepID=UPI001B3315E9|nr:hypothetical protein [Streptomyces sp. GESEQ-4]